MSAEHKGGTPGAGTPEQHAGTAVDVGKKEGIIQIDRWLGAVNTLDDPGLNLLGSPYGSVHTSLTTYYMEPGTPGGKPDEQRLIEELFRRCSRPLGIGVDSQRPSTVEGAPSTEPVLGQKRYKFIITKNPDPTVDNYTLKIVPADDLPIMPTPNVGSTSHIFREMAREAIEADMDFKLTPSLMLLEASEQLPASPPKHHKEKPRKRQPTHSPHPFINQELGLSKDMEPTFASLELRPNSELWLQDALVRLEHAIDLTGREGKHALADVFRCFAPVPELNTELTARIPKIASLGDQISDVLAAYQDKALSPQQKQVFEQFTQLAFLALAGNTALDAPEGAAIFTEELTTGKVTDTRYTPDALGEQALQTLDHLQELFLSHKADTTPHTYTHSRHRGVKIAGVITAMQLLFTACTTIGPNGTPQFPTDSPIVEVTPIPPSFTKTPDVIQPTSTATIEATATIAPKPEDSAAYPSTIARTTLTDAAIAIQKKAFTNLTVPDSYMALEAKTLENQLKQIGGPDITTYGVVDKSRWGVFAQKKDGTPLILQKTADGGKTWVNVIDASAYSELVALQSFDPDNYRFVPLNRPSGIPKDATTGVIAEQNWMVYVFRDTEGSILAWYDAANDVFRTVQGEELKLQEYAYKPLSEMTTWEECVQQRLPNVDDPEFPRAFDAFIKATTPEQEPDQSDHQWRQIYGEKIQFFNRPGAAIYEFYATNFSASMVSKDTHGMMLGCATMDNGLQVYRFYVRTIPSEQVSEFGTAYVILTVAFDPVMYNTLWDMKPMPNDFRNKLPFSAQFPAMKDYIAISGGILTSPHKPIDPRALTDPLTAKIAQLIQQNQQNGAEQAFLDLLDRIITPESKKKLEQAIFPADAIFLDSLNSK